MPSLLLHADKTFRDQVVYATGHAYQGCVFEACTIVAQSIGPGVFQNCRFNGCVWHLNLVIHDSDQWDEFMGGFAAIITKSLPRDHPRT
ncbi:MAG: hypothetical protein KDA05_08745 [Phycisphaerales bacterium]|nr:hypothetical protein [Phycisphaerales bacterium]MCB9841557.1 hypothetical protein [Phycisphaeraceae bacterium]